MKNESVKSPWYWKPIGYWLSVSKTKLANYEQGLPWFVKEVFLTSVLQYYVPIYHGSFALPWKYDMSKKTIENA